MELNTWIEEGLEASNPDNIPYYHYHGPLDLGITWMSTFSMTRDSDLLETSNFDSITADMEERFPDDVMIERSGHWAVGWIDTLRVRVYDDDNEFTEAILAAYGYWQALQDYPVIDEEDYSNREYEEAMDMLEQALPSNMKDDLPKDYIEEIWRWLSDSNIYYTEDSGWNYNDVKEACEALNYLEDEDD